MSRAEDRIGDRELSQWRTPAGRVVADAAVRVLGHREVTLLALTALVGALVMGLLTALSAELYDAVTEHEGIALVDKPVLMDMVALRSPGWDRVVAFFTTIGGPVVMPVLATAVVLVMAWRWRSRTPIVLMVVGAAGSLATTIVGKDYIGRVRPAYEWAVPPYETSPSFPSGHSLNAVVVSGIIAYLLLLHLRSRRARWAVVAAAVVYSLLMGLSRVYLGHHWLTDVLVGWTMGGAWLTVVITAHRLTLTLRHRSATAAREP